MLQLSGCKVWKSSPDEKVGVVAKKSGRPSVVEYSAGLRRSPGRLRLPPFWEDWE